MAKIKYRYNPETLSFDRITFTLRQKLKQLGIMFVISIFISVGYFAIYSCFYDTPKERTMTNKLSDLRFSYQMLSQDLQHIDKILSDIQKRDDDIYRTVLESEPIPASIRQAGFGGVNRYEPLEGYKHSNMMIAVTKHTDKILMQLCVQSKSYDELIDKAIQKEQMTQSRPAIQPIANKDLRSQMSKFGMRMHPVHREWRMHTGMDFSAKSGTPIFATGDGTVVKSEYNHGGYGWMVVIDHGIIGYHTLYGHMLKKGMEVGAEVKRGQVIGFVGSTGTSTSPHVHYEVHKNGYRNYVNPIHYFYADFSDEEYSQMVEQAQNSDAIFEDWQSQDSDDFVPDDDLVPEEVNQVSEDVEP